MKYQWQVVNLCWPIGECGRWQLVVPLDFPLDLEVWLCVCVYTPISPTGLFLVFLEVCTTDGQRYSHSFSFQLVFPWWKVFYRVFVCLFVLSTNTLFHDILSWCKLAVSSFSLEHDNSWTASCEKQKLVSSVFHSLFWREPNC